MKNADFIFFRKALPDQCRKHRHTQLWQETLLYGVVFFVPVLWKPLCWVCVKLIKKKPIPTRYYYLFSDSGLYTLWSMGNETFLNAGFFIPIILHHLIMLTLDFLAFHLYQKINDRLTDKQVADGSSKSTQVDFHNILELASGKPPPSKDTTDSSNRRIEDDQDHRHRHHNFVPWRIHRQVLICTTVASSILILAFIFISKFHPFVQTLDFLQLVLRIVANFLEYFKSKKELHRICSINFSNICAAAIWWTRKTEKMPFHLS